MSHDHNHDHHHTATGRHRHRLIWVASMTAAMVVVEIIGGWLSGSLALFADASHLLTDSAGLIIALIATALAARPATKARTFGLQRAEILAAGVNALLLIGIGISVLISAITRWNTTEEISTGLMATIAVVGGVVNLVGLLVLRGGRDESLNLRGAYLEVLTDLIGSGAVVLAALAISITGWIWIDSVVAIAIFALIVPRAWALLREVLEVLLESTPNGIDLDVVRSRLCEISGVITIHDLHAWTITSGSATLSAHVVVTDEYFVTARQCLLLDQLNQCLEDHFELTHCTLQLEPLQHLSHEEHVHA
jgi:cobalt-zinc-cadmium efflux system protein